ncbi:MAG: MFS transporter [Candidatus Peribacteraceae bacterium]|nr:MFS transporter [Candidatus Peribacteraceae bacterium]MDD5742415.1 MFS transporter [Candidatus Peribacteraceae bacterium]
MATTDTPLRSNLWKLYALSAIATFGFAMPIVIPFQQEHGLTLQQAFALQSIYSIVLVILEVPSGYIADRWGRRNTILLGSFTLFLGMLSYAVTGGFWGFVFAETLLAIGFSFHSGTTEALTYDTLDTLGEKKRYLKVNGLQGFFALGSKAVTSLLVGSLAAVSLRLPFWADVCLFGSATILSFTLVEPDRVVMKETQHLKAMGKIFLHALVHNKILQSTILLFTVVAAIDIQMFWLLQSYQLEIGLPMTFFGIANAAMCLLGALAYKESHRFAKRSERLGTLFAIAFVLIATSFALSAVSALWGLAFFVLEGMMFGLFDPIASNIINHQTTSDVRATVLSIRSFAARILFAALTPFLGYMADAYSLSVAFLLTGAVGITALAVTFMMIRRVRA